jgi:hypothetical protein
MTKVAVAPGDYAGLHKEVVSVVESARRTAARNVNAVMTAAYLEIGRRIIASEQGGQARAGYGQAVIVRLAEDLTRRFGRGFGKANLASMRAFYVAWAGGGDFPDSSQFEVGIKSRGRPSGVALLSSAGLVSGMNTAKKMSATALMTARVRKPVVKPNISTTYPPVTLLSAAPIPTASAMRP